MDRPGSSGATPLMAAASAGNGGIVDILLKGGANTALRDGEGRTAHMLAARKGHTQVVQAIKAATGQ